MQLYGVCESIGECPKHTAKVQGASSDDKRMLQLFAEKAAMQRKAMIAARNALKKAREMAEQAEEKESKLEEDAEQQEEAEAGCKDALRTIRAQEAVVILVWIKSVQNHGS